MESHRKSNTTISQHKKANLSRKYIAASLAVGLALYSAYKPGHYQASGTSAIHTNTTKAEEPERAIASSGQELPNIFSVVSSTDTQVTYQDIMELNQKYLDSQHSAEPLISHVILKLTINSTLAAIKDQQILGKTLADNRIAADIKKAALVYINDIQILKQIANDEHVEATDRIEVLNRVDDDEQWLRASHSKDEMIRIESIMHVDGATLESMADTDESAAVRAQALDYIRDHQSPRSLWDEREAIAMQEAPENSADQEFLGQTALNASAMNDITNEEERIEAVDKLNDTAILQTLSEDDSDAVVRRTAKSRLQDLESQ